MMTVLTRPEVSNGQGALNLYENGFYKTLKAPLQSMSWATLIHICGVLENFFSVPDQESYCNYLIKNDFISLLLNLVKKYLSEESFLLAAFSVLALIVRTLEGCSTFIALRGVPLITDLVEKHGDNEPLCASGLRVLASCSLDKSSFKELADKGVVDIVLKHIDTAKAELLAVLLEIVKNMTSDEVYVTMMEDRDVVSHFYGVLTRCSEYEEVMSGVTGSCMHMCTSQRSRSLFLQQELEVEVVQVMRQHSKSMTVQYYGAAVIFALMEETNLCEVLMEQDILSIVIPAMALLCEDAKAEKVLFAIFQRLLDNGDVHLEAEAFTELHFMEAVGKVLESNHADESTVVPALTSLTSLERRIPGFFEEVKEPVFFKAFSSCYLEETSQ